MEHKGTLRLENDRIILCQFPKEYYESVYKNSESDYVMTKYLRWKADENIKAGIEVVNGWIESYENMNFYQ